MSVPLDRRPERAVQAKIRGIQKIYFRWIENPKRRSRQKLGFFRKIIQKNDEQKKNTKTKTEASQFKLVNWRNALGAGLQMVTSAKWLIDGFYPEMATSASGLIDGDFCQSVWLMGFIPIDGDFCLWYWWMTTSACALIDGDFCQMVDWLVSSREMATSAKIWVVTPSVVESMGRYPFSGMIDGLLPFQVIELMVCYPFSGLNMGFTPSVVWIWALPHQLVWIWTLPISGLFDGISPH